MTLNGVMAFILRSFTKFGSFGANDIIVVVLRPILSVLDKNQLKASNLRKYSL